MKKQFEKGKAHISPICQWAGLDLRKVPALAPQTSRDSLKSLEHANTQCRLKHGTDIATARHTIGNADDDNQTGDGWTVSVLHFPFNSHQFTSFTWITGSSTGSLSSRTLLTLDIQPLQKGKIHLSAAATDRSRRASARLNHKSGAEMIDRGTKKRTKETKQRTERARVMATKLPTMSQPPTRCRARTKGAQINSTGSSSPGV